MSTPAQAVTSVKSSAYDIMVNLTVVSRLGVGLNPLSEAAGFAGDPYASSDGAVSVNQNLNIGVSRLVGLRERIGAGATRVRAQSQYPAAQVGSASADIDNLSSQLGLYSGITFGNLLTIGASSANSTSSVSNSGGVGATGFSRLEGLVLSGTLLGGATIDGSAFVTPDPNYVLFSLGLLGQETLKIILNEQVKTGDGVANAGISTNAIHLIFSRLNVAGIGLLSGDIIIAHSEAQLSEGFANVPEPATWLQMIAGFGVVGILARRRRRIPA